MKCSNCGKEIAEDSKFCVYCGTQVTNFTENVEVVQKPKDEISVGLNIISFLIPLIGLISYFSCRKDSPKRAKSVLKYALIGLVISIVLQFL